jgi:hypothetical protein
MLVEFDCGNSELVEFVANKGTNEPVLGGFGSAFFRPTFSAHAALLRNEQIIRSGEAISS